MYLRTALKTLLELTLKKTYKLFIKRLLEFSYKKFFFKKTYNQCGQIGRFW